MKHLLLSLLVCLALAFSASAKLHQSVVVISHPTFENLHDCIGQPLGTLGKVAGLQPRSVTVQSDDGTDIPAVKYYKGSKVVLQFEGTPSADTVRCVRILSSRLKLGRIFIGQHFFAVSSMFSETVPPFPDGSLYLILADYPFVTVGFDISHVHDSRIFYGEVRLDAIPQGLKVNEVVIK